MDSVPSIRILTKNAVITSKYTLLKNHSKYYMPNHNLKDIDEDTVVKMYYRRFIRLRPLISRTRMVKETYTSYIRYKFKIENYQLKRKLVTGIEEQRPLIPTLQKSLEFIIKSVSFIPETKTIKFKIARDNTICRQVLKNLLTVEYQKENFIEKRSKGSELYQLLRVDFNHLVNSNNNLKFTSQLKVFNDFDMCLILMNETIGTRL
ncbi:hypothetical protein Kpol_388p10 [Vanderwaltozyma polyspora DSM 70294]|uniref:Increased recombination centers protein 19 n=1 Tax=Vanderwaltozyma polyspora (strain ATCC 22028 / DSM 70294 / BCRC 21397 / CBS 2163 / NBRC 10782 / NRRL Y-8283 / UCD 57-17) TaxID=436907 RepID=IRC19_VANPO|nr:uncharacterized protein Kpol_388p10 [Vanderwaltozyma polyspora DSM 70294]A7TRZ8.1 RecName: Full=Increased recombination centers protein 19 [Vanderwaltozyma polyspora DSM 70294]EDO14966.1 hypothetical protein Kpol_388p10 [Vanderwaltozyma polyspora DSM 70294]